MRRQKLLYYVSISLSVLVLLSNFGKTLILIDFFVHQDYITNNLCKNRYKPEVLCSGKCVLTKTVETHEKQDQKKIPSHLKDVNESILFIAPVAFILPFSKSIIVSTNRPVFIGLKGYSSFLSDIFHPPQ